MSCLVLFWFGLLTRLSTLDALYIGGTLLDFFLCFVYPFYPRDVYVLFIRESSIRLTVGIRHDIVRKDPMKPSIRSTHVIRHMTENYYLSRAIK